MDWAGHLNRTHCYRWARLRDTSQSGTNQTVNQLHTIASVCDARSLVCSCRFEEREPLWVWHMREHSCVAIGNRSALLPSPPSYPIPSPSPLAPPHPHAVHPCIYQVRLELHYPEQAWTSLFQLYLHENRTLWRPQLLIPWHVKLYIISGEVKNQSMNLVSTHPSCHRCLRLKQSRRNIAKKSLPQFFPSTIEACHWKWCEKQSTNRVLRTSLVPLTLKPKKVEKS